MKFYTKELVHRNLGGKKVLILFVLTGFVYLFMLLVTVPEVLGFTAGMKLFDLMPMGYTPEYANSLLEKLGSEGRNAYLFHQIPVDLIFPLLYGSTFCLMIAYFLRELGSLKDPFFYLCLLPLMSGFFDYLENFGIIFMLVSYPDTSVSGIELASFFTVFKSLLSTIGCIVLIILLVLYGFRKLFRK